MSVLQLKNTSESDPRSYVVTLAVTNKAQKKFWGFNGIQTHDWAMKPHWKQVKCEFNLYLLYEENEMICIW